MKGRSPIFLLSIVMMVIFPLSVFAGDLELTQDNKIPGKPFQDLQDQINYLQQQIDDLVIGNHVTSTYYVQCNQAPGISTDECEAFCPVGTVVTGGGINTWSNSQYLKINLATPDASTNKFRCSVLNEGVTDLFYFCYANCLSSE